MNRIENIILIFNNPKLTSLPGRFGQPTVKGTFEYFSMARLYEIVFRDERLVLKSYSGIASWMPVYYNLLRTEPEYPPEIVYNYWRLLNE